MTTQPLRVDRLWPDPAADLSLDEAFARIELPSMPGRPLVALNMVTSIDGRAQRDGTAEGLSGRADRRLMQLYRAAYDALGTGAGTLRADDFHAGLAPDLAQRRTAAGLPLQPLAILVAGAEALPLDRRWFVPDGAGDQRRVTIVGATSPYATRPLPAGETWVAPTPRPDPAWIVDRLGDEGVRTLLMEGGPTLNAAFLAAGLVDELYWTIGARLLGNRALQMIAPSTGGPSPDLPREGSLVSVHRAGDELFIRYRFPADRVE